MRWTASLALFTALVACGEASDGAVAASDQAATCTCPHSPLTLSGVFSFERIYSAPNGPTVTSSRKLGDAIVFETDTPADLIVDHELWVDLETAGQLETCQRPDCAITQVADDVDLGLVAQIASDGRLTFGFEGLPAGHTGDTAFREQPNTQRKLWAMSVDPNDDELAVLLTGLPEPESRGLMAVFDGPTTRAQTYSRLQLQIPDGGKLAIGRAEGVVTIRPAVP